MSTAAVECRRWTSPYSTAQKPAIWADHCVGFFRLYQVQESMWVTATTINMVDNAALWLQAYKVEHTLGDWDMFLAAVFDEFGADEHEAVLLDLMCLRPTPLTLIGTVLASSSTNSAFMILAPVRSPWYCNFCMGCVMTFGPPIRRWPRRPRLHANMSSLWNVLGAQLHAARPPLGPSPLHRQDLHPSPVQQNAGELWRAQHLKEYHRANGL